ncbi:hypothetical protein J4211_05580 [Candidatus Woesearchaeota archaeon]|nr:hypothetical protein [Candidatus Woesearchaeota archaeon]
MVVTPEEAKKGDKGKQVLQGVARVFEADLDALLAEGKGRSLGTPVEYFDEFNAKVECITRDSYSLNYFRSMPLCSEQTACVLLKAYQTAGWKVSYHPYVQGLLKLHCDCFTFVLV